MKRFTQGCCAVAAAAALLLASATACDGGGQQTLEIVSPSRGAEVQVPFEVTFDSSAPLGSPDGDLHHLHLWFSDDETAYLVVESTTVEVTQAPVGEQVMTVSLRNPDHTRAGVEASVRLVIAPGSGE